MMGYYYGSGETVPFDTLVGKTFKSVANLDDEEIFFVEEGGLQFKLLHQQDCCESVLVDDIVGDLSDLIGSPIVRAEERSSEGDPKEQYDESCTWTFYEIATAKGSVTIRWYGTSNGYYSESVDLVRLSTAA